MSNALYYEAKNAAESYAEYGCADVVKRFETKTSFPRDELKTNPISVPDSADSFFSGSNIDLTQTEVKGGQIEDGYWIYLDADDPRWEFDPMKGKRVFVRDVQIYAKSTATSDVIDSTKTAYVQQTLQVRDSPLFSYAIFYNVDLELHPGPIMHIYGPVHTNRNAWLESCDKIYFHDTVTASGKILHGNPTKSTAPHTQSGSVLLINADDEFVDMKLGNYTSSDSNWLDHRNANWRQLSSQAWDGNVQDSAHNVPVYNAAGIADHVPDDPTTAKNELENHAYAVIEPLLPYNHADRKTAAVRNQKMEAKAGLIFKVELDSTTTTGLKIRAYKWARTNTSTPVNPQSPFDDLALDANGDPYMIEVQLPSSDLFPTLLSSDIIGKEKSNLTGVDNDSNIAEPALYEYSGGVTKGLYDHRQDMELSTLSLDLGVLRKVVDDNANPSGTDLGDVYWKDASTNVVTYNPKTDWNGIIYIEFPLESNSGGATDKIVRAEPDLSVTTTTYEDQEVVVGQKLTTTTSYTYVGKNKGDYNKNYDGSYYYVGVNKGKYDQITSQEWVDVTEIQSVAVQSTKTVHLVVQLLNGSLLPSPTFCEPGLTIATNAPLYVVGNYNADGVVHTDDAQLIEHKHYTDYYGNYFDEPPASIMCDTYTQLSTNWPNTRKYSAESSTSNRKARFTEASVAVLTGLSPTLPDSGEISGGAHNFPRFLENWDGYTFTLRTSMVALFENEVHTAPMPESNAGHYYSPPLRDWGFNENFDKGVYPPGTPNVRTFRRTKFEDIGASAYSAGTNF